MDLEKCVDLKRATFYPDRIIIKRKKGNVVLNKEDIENIFYDRFNFWNFIILGKNVCTLEIVLSKKAQTPLRKLYYLPMRYKTVLKIQAILEMRIHIYEL